MASTFLRAPRFVPKLTRERHALALDQLKGIAFFSGFFIWRDPLLLADLRSLDCPLLKEGMLKTYHSFGTQDTVISCDKSEELARACQASAQWGTFELGRFFYFDNCPIICSCRYWLLA